MSVELQQVQQAFAEFTNAAQLVIDRKLLSISCPFDDLPEEVQEREISRMGGHVSFEYEQSQIEGIRLCIGGYGMFLLFLEGELEGTQEISDGDSIEGQLAGAGVYTVPSVEMLKVQDDEGNFPELIEYSLTYFIVLQNGVFKTGIKKDGRYANAHQLPEHELMVPMSPYSLTPTVVGD